MKSKDTAIASFVLGLLCWVPWLNWIISLLAVYFGLKALWRIRKQPDKHGGTAFAVIGTTLGTLTLIVNITGVLFYS